jgi:predicted nucleic acid-binding protein
VKFWDTSALVPLLVDELSSREMRTILSGDRDVAVWWATVVECVSAIGRRERFGTVGPSRASESYESLAILAASWSDIPPSEAIRDDARRLARVHDLRAADAFQLAAARAASDDYPETLPFVTLDDRLALAASREGFPVLGLD